MAGYNGGLIENCTSSGSVSSSSSSSSSSSAGGIAGYNVGPIGNCTSSGSVSSSSSSSCAGGIAGVNARTIENCTSSGRDISAINTTRGEAYRGGLIGRNYLGHTIRGNHNETGISPAIGWDEREDPDGPSDNI
ncbi:MAG: hypothetical protein LBP21_11470 [Synergistaceae bacterium]|nr:hypothetical protein [Synergistaceae bacterium]